MSVRRTLLLAAAVGAAPTCPAIGTNLIKNPGFEDSPTSAAPWTSRNNKLVISKPGYLSDNALLLNYNSSVNDAGFEQAIAPPCAGSYYFTYYYKFDRNSSSDVAIITSSEGGNFAVDIPTQTTNEWKQYANFVVEKPSPSTLFQVSYFRPVSQPKKQPNVLFDNFQFNQANFNVKPNAREQVVNGGFQDKTLSPWTVRYGAASVVSDGTPQGRALQVTPDNQDNTIEQAVKTLKPGGTYRLSFNYSYPKKPTSESFVLLSLRVDGGGSGGYFGYDVAQKGKGTYTRDFIAYGDVSTIQINVDYGLFDTSAWAPILIDNVSIKATA